MNETKLIGKLQLIETLFTGATTDGEKHASFNALQRIKKRLKEIKKIDPPVENKFTMSDSLCHSSCTRSRNSATFRPWSFRSR